MSLSSTSALSGVMRRYFHPTRPLLFCTAELFCHRQTPIPVPFDAQTVYRVLRPVYDESHQEKCSLIVSGVSSTGVACWVNHSKERDTFAA
jgi:hypothetical protein